MVTVRDTDQELTRCRVLGGRAVERVPEKPWRLNGTGPLRTKQVFEARTQRSRKGAQEEEAKLYLALWNMIGTFNFMLHENETVNQLSLR